MADMYRKISVISVLTFIAAATLLIGVACTVEPPISPGKENQLDTGEAAHLVAPSAPESDSVVSITVDQVGTVAVDGVAQPLTTLATTLAAVPENSIASLEAHKSAPYRVVSAVQDHLRQAGLLRVVFTEVESEELDAAPQDLASLLSRGLATVLPPAPAREVEISRRNLLELEVRPGGSVTAIRGRDESRQETTPEGVEAMVRSELQLNPNLVAVVRTYPDAEYRHMFAVVSALQRAKATRYSIQMVEERP